MELSGQRIHFLGVGGVGVSALAFMARHFGALVDGCDRCENGMTAMLAAEGIPVRIGHSPFHTADADLAVYSSAVCPSEPELLAAKKIEKRGAFLARLLANAGTAYGVAGTHGKTTTSWLLSRMLIAAGRDPSVFVGGNVPELGGRNYRVGSGPFVAELDESDGSFLLPRLDMAIVTNIESEHLSYYGSDQAMFAAFDEFAERVTEKGVLIAGIDDNGGRNLLERTAGKKISFGIDGNADARAVEVELTPNESRFRLEWRGRDLGVFRTAFPGLHNIQNALAALAGALEDGVEPETAKAALAEAQSVGRRMEALGSFCGAALYSDYAHHPTEVAAAIDAARQRHAGELLVVFQPHLYSRTRDYADAFGAALARADVVLVTEIYPSREEPLPGVDAGLVVEAARKRGANVHGPYSLDEAAAKAADLARKCAAAIMMGAGSIDAVARSIAVKGA